MRRVNTSLSGKEEALKCLSGEVSMAGKKFQWLKGSYFVVVYQNHMKSMIYYYRLDWLAV